MGANYFKIKRLPIAHQVLAMKGIHPRFHCASKGNHAVWKGPIKPSAMSHEYLVKIAYEFGDSPKVWVVSPQLTTRYSGGRIPHVHPGPRPCLYLPNSGEWKPDRYIADTIVPWTSLWLYFYEVWHATGEWLGGGVHPDPHVVKQQGRDDD